jgi:hypothetical protein
MCNSIATPHGLELFQQDNFAHDLLRGLHSARISLITACGLPGNIIRGLGVQAVGTRTLFKWFTFAASVMKPSSLQKQQSKRGVSKEKK